MLSKRFCPTGTKAYITQLGIKKLQNHCIVKIVQLVTVIEYLQRNEIMGYGNLPVFAPHSQFQSSNDVIVWIRKTFISRRFNLTKGLQKIGITLKYKQTYHDNYSYVVDDISKDLSDGFILSKVTERTFNIDDRKVLLSLGLPKENTFRKLVNVQKVLNFIKGHNIDIGNIMAKDIVQGKTPKIMELIWKMIRVFEGQKDRHEILRRMSRRLKKLS